MIAMAVILALSGALILGLIAYWRNIVDLIKKVGDKIKEKLGIAVQGTRTFILKLRDGIKNRSKYYHENKQTGEWEEHVYTKDVNESEIPADILAKVRNAKMDYEVSTTDELKLAISA